MSYKKRFNTVAGDSGLPATNFNIIDFNGGN